MALASAVLHRLFFWNSRSKAMQPPRLAEKPWAIQPIPNYSRPAPQGCRWGASSPPATHLWPVSAPEAHRPLTPIWGRHGDGLSNGSASRMGHGEREGGTQALAHSTIPIQVRPA